MHKIGKITWLSVAIQTTLSLLIGTVLAWSCFRGFDLTDESYYYTGYLHFLDAPGEDGASFHMILNRFFSFANLTLPEMRMLRLLLTFCSSVVLYKGLSMVFNPKHLVHKITLFNIVCCGMFLSYSWAPSALSYNSISTIIYGLFVGSWILLCANSHSFLQRHIYFFVLGFLSVLLFFNKITNITLILLMIIGTSIWWYRRMKGTQLEVKKIVYGLLSIVLGSLLSIRLLSKETSLMWETITSHLNASVGIATADVNYSITTLFSAYAMQVMYGLWELKIPFLLLGLVFAIVFLINKYFDERKYQKLELTFQLSTLIILIITVVIQDYWRGGINVNYLLNPYIILGMCLFLYLLFFRRKMDYVIILGLVGVAITGSVGTSNNLLSNLIFYGTYFFVIIYYLAYQIPKSYYRDIILTFTIGICAIQVINGTVYNPYRQSELKHAKHRIQDVASLKGLKVDEATYLLRQELSFLEDEHVKFLFTYSHQLGMVLLSNKKPLTLAWVAPLTFRPICEAYETSKIDPKKLGFLIPSSSPLDVQLLDCLKKLGVNFYKDYKSIHKFNYYDHVLKTEVEMEVYLFNQQVTTLSTNDMMIRSISR